MDIARDICTDSFYIVNSGLPCIPVTAVGCIYLGLRKAYRIKITFVRKVPYGPVFPLWISTFEARLGLGQDPLYINTYTSLRFKET